MKKFLKDPNKRMKRQATHKEKISESHVSDKGIAIGIYKELSKLNSKKTKQSNQKAGKKHEQRFHQRRHAGGQ